jgi:hypothetical protein
MSFCFSCFRFHVSTFIVCALVLHRLNVQTPKHVVIASGLQVKLNLKTPMLFYPKLFVLAQYAGIFIDSICFVLDGRVFNRDLVF